LQSEAYQGFVTRKPKRVTANQRKSKLNVL